MAREERHSESLEETMSECLVLTAVDAVRVGCSKCNKCLQSCDNHNFAEFEYVVDGPNRDW